MNCFINMFVHFSFFILLHTHLKYTKHPHIGGQRFETKHGQTRRGLAFINGHHPEVALLIRENVRMAIDVLLRGGAQKSADEKCCIDEKCLEFIQSDSFSHIFNTPENGVYGNDDAEDDQYCTSTNACRVVTNHYFEGKFDVRLALAGRNYGLFLPDEIIIQVLIVIPYVWFACVF